jgi:hypothetical protein
MIIGFPGNLGDPAFSIDNCRLEYRLTNSRMIPQPSCPGRRGTNQGRSRWYRRAKETECGEMGGGESEDLIVALKQGNGPSRTLWSEGGCRVVY